jgi:hypothetical protein
MEKEVNSKHLFSMSSLGPLAPIGVRGGSSGNKNPVSSRNLDDSMDDDEMFKQIMGVDLDKPKGSAPCVSIPKT